MELGTVRTSLTGEEQRGDMFSGEGGRKAGEPALFKSGLTL